ncbi:MAG: PAS domain S-box protein [Methylocystis sp.]
MRDVNAAAGFLEQVTAAPKLAAATARRWLRSFFPGNLLARRVALGVGAAALGLALRFGVQDLLGGRLAYVTFYPVVTIAAFFGGAMSGLIAAALCAGIAHMWFFPLSDAGDWIGLAIFVTSSAIISGTGEALHLARFEADFARERAADKDRLQVANERLRLAMSAGAVVAWDFDAVANVFDASPKLRDLFGLSSDARVDPSVLFDAVLPEDRPAAREAFFAALDPARDGRYAAEYRIRRADGADSWISSQAQASLVQGRAVGLIGVSRDITQQKQAESLLLEKAQLAEQLVKVAASVPGVICSFRRDADGKGSFPYVSAHFQEVYGLLPEDVKDDGAPVFQRIHPDDLHHVAASIEQSARTRTLWRDIFRYEHPRKGWIWIEGQSAPVFEPSGAIVWHGFLQDVTARKRAEDALKENETHLRAFYDSGLLGVMCWEANGAISEANDKFLEMLGYSREDLEAGRLNWIKITPPEYASTDQAALAEVRRIGATQGPFEKEYLCKDGERLPILIAASAFDAAGENGVAFALDISDRKRAEAELQRLYASRFDMMRRMAAGFAHEITQPLTAAGAYAAAARRMLDVHSGGGPADVGEIMGKTAAEVARAGRVITKLREFIDHSEPDMLPAGLHELVREALVEALGSDATVTVKLALNAARDAVLVDKAQLVLVLVNLIRNAKAAMAASGEGVLTIATACDEQQLQVDVIDTGSGMSPQLLENLFEPFPTTENGSAGMGIGLSVSRGIIEAHHGRIWAKPNADGGTAVSFWLPLLDLQAQS